MEKRYREKQWWMNEGELELHNGDRLDEAYDPSRLKPGYDGRNGPDVKTLYAGKEERFDKLGANGGENQEEEKPKKGAADTANLSVKERKQKIKEFEDQQGMDNLENDGIDDVPPEMDEPIDQEDDFEDDGMGEGAEEKADDITVEVEGQKFRLVPVEDEMGEEGMEDEFKGDELNTDVPPSGEVGAERNDVEYPESAKAYARKLLKMKAFAEAKLKELFTGDYVFTTDDKGGLAGLNFKGVTGDKDFAVIARAASGDQYTVTDSKSPYEPGSEAKGQTGGGKVNKLAVASKESFKAWLKNEYLREEEVGAEGGQEDPGKTSQEFNDQDLFGTITKRSPLSPKNFAKEPEIVGLGNPSKMQGTGDGSPTSGYDDTTIMTVPKTAEEHSNAHVGESTKARLDLIKKARLARRQAESNVVKDNKKMNVLEETMDFKKIIRGDYNKIQE